MPASPFTCGGTVQTITVPFARKLVIRADADSLLLSINRSVVDGSKVDRYLKADEAVVITNHNQNDTRDMIVNVVNKTGDPNVYFSIE